ncbi:Uncharacterised protein [Mycobacteroides abscessus subsp. abscessus]|uniref:hypothetical protein n=1 Tax=Mycobacteroides abscessus TaxID=36809 RepID=UPI00092C3B5B|nr:hypothetical protein [Mycobacteroides abscessus]SIC61737.1 Uncharacterised protein [Mycobacteroides abscessus subsp. abscessus]SIC93207.1 Uncharacterised protein [Mycobacteroides abscessus subsp. abscessus]SID22413.1 Uncharacterised protein [Mycobacteroides abscessus subsp. abscessus]SID50899.1 Uncharacterised protein [Mycobacteroides abscessus subsp. abscessus]SKT56611.1 Uncharacterised protein [Mycobacteroides abscessus subsp. abscessus]
MHEYNIDIEHFLDDDDNIITTAMTNPAAISVSCRSTGEPVDCEADADTALKMGRLGFLELITACAQAAFAHRYDVMDRAALTRQ